MHTVTYLFTFILCHIAIKIIKPQLMWRQLLRQAKAVIVPGKRTLYIGDRGAQAGWRQWGLKSWWWDFIAAKRSITAEAADMMGGLPFPEGLARARLHHSCQVSDHLESWFTQVPWKFPSETSLWPVLDWARERSGGLCMAGPSLCSGDFKSKRMMPKSWSGPVPSPRALETL